MRNDIILRRGYSHDIEGDDFDLKIASYPISAKYLASRIIRKSGEGASICELCCGIGVSLIEFSHSFAKVIGVDNDLKAIAAAEKNLQAANAKNVQLIEGDVSDKELLKKIKATIVAYDIPYWSDHGGTLNAGQKNPDIKKMITMIQYFITSNIVISAPPSTTYEAATTLFGECEMDEIWIDGVHDRNFIFLGKLIEEPGKKTINLDMRSDK